MLHRTTTRPLDWHEARGQRTPHPAAVIARADHAAVGADRRGRRATGGRFPDLLRRLMPAGSSARDTAPATRVGA